MLNFIESDRVDHLGNEVYTGVAVNDNPEGLIAFLTSGAKLSQPIYLNGRQPNWRGEG
ncbi:hypothetical protein ACI7RC_10065 [Brevibacillus sp. B_LB10_24]|uniref:hypothetical protein n=1 Tax=Brevibacillus sp. B_LB10_24 TaxID=3380645 RepID=UPI0038B93DE3